jgi:hypothetical protein
MDGNEIDCTSGGLHLNYNSQNDLLVRTNTRLAEITMTHNSGSGVNNGFALENEGANNAFWTLYSTNSDGNLEFYYQGNLRGEFNSSTGAYTALSDARLKENIRPLTGVLERVKALKPSAYNFKDDARKTPQFGLIAQEAMELFPELVHKGTIGDTEKEIYTMDYSALSVIALAAIQELAEEKISNQQLLQENQEMKTRLTALEDRLAKLEALAERK